MRTPPSTITALVLVTSTVLLSGCISRLLPPRDAENGTGSNIIQQTESGVTRIFQGTGTTTMPGTMFETGAALDGVSTISTPGSTQVAQAGSLRIDIESNKEETHSGDSLQYTVTLQNMTATALSGLQVEAAFPLTKMTIADAGAGVVQSDRVLWDINLSANATRTFTYTANVKTEAQHGDSLLTIVTVRGASLSLPVIATQEVRVLGEGNLPRAGAGEYTRPLENMSKYLKPIQ
jgi:hypothetical protein